MSPEERRRRLAKARERAAESNRELKDILDRVNGRIAARRREREERLDRRRRLIRRLLPFRRAA